jgi:hypothetical protein
MNTTQRLALAVGAPLVNYAGFQVIAPERLERRGALLIHPRLAPEWRLLLLVFVFWYDRCGLSYAEMQRRRVAPTFVTRKIYDACSDFMRDCGVIFKAPRAGTYWLDPWNRDRFVRYVRLDALPLPYPAKEPPAFPSTLAQSTHSTDAPPLHRLAARSALDLLTVPAQITAEAA